VKTSMRRALAVMSATVAVVAGTLAVTTQSAQAAVSCHTFSKKTGGGLDGKTYLMMCENQHFVQSFHASHENTGGHSHTGKILIADNHNQQKSSANMTIRPDEEKQLDWTINQDWQSGHRVCAVWVISNGTKTNHVCGKMSDIGFLED